MRKRDNNQGFTMAEMLIVVAIIIVLAAVAFIAVANYQRSMTQLEYDTIAKEIFIAAQNHLTTAESQGYNGLKNTETKAVYGQTSSFGTDSADKVYYIASSYPGDAVEMLDLMLPFGSIDETVRAGGSYIIRYQPSSARVLEVFYSNPNQTSALTVKGTQLGVGENFSYKSLMAIRGDDEKYKSARRNFHNAVIGWYGDTDALPTGKKLNVPVVKIHNEEKLWVEITDTNDSETSLVLLVTGKTSEAQCKFVLRGDSADSTGRVANGQNGQKIVILDDITTANMRFAKIEGQKIVTPGGSKASFIPGEDLYIEAVAFNNKALTNIAYSGKQTTNSLFKSIDMEAAGGSQKPVAKIENFRHLENLDPRVSAFASANCYKDGAGNAVPVTNAKQIQNMIWTGSNSAFLERIVSLPVAGDDKNAVQIYWYKATEGSIPTVKTSKPGCYLPVNLSDSEYALTYSGNSHSISNVKVDLDSGDADLCGDAGLFGSLKTASVSDLELIDFSILTASGNAGALAGSLDTCTVSNVLAHNSTNVAEVNITASGSAGGLIGSQSDGKTEYSAAAVIVWPRTVTTGGKSVTVTPTVAGGLIGTMTGGTINGCYSGGHTEKAKYFIDGSAAYNEDNTGIPINGKYNVIGATAGGLIGNTSAAISKCYSTCSASGTAYAGGFAGVVAGGSIEDSYSTGLVSGSYDLDSRLIVNNAFLGSLTGNASFKGNHYYQIINEVRVPSAEGSKSIKIEYKGSGGSSEHADLAGITPFDSSKESFESFIEKYKDAGGEEKPWTEDKPAKPYDEVLETYYKEKYFLPTVAQLGASVPNGYFVKTHYGDWPAPEVFIINSNS